MSRYFFRDIEHGDNLLNGKTYHAAGIVDHMYCVIGLPNPSGKDLSVTFIEPFEGTLTSTWRALGEVELFEVDQWEHEQLSKMHEAIKAATRTT